MHEGLGAVAAALALTASAQAQLPAPAACAISAYVVDRDVGGLNVRAAPSTRAPVLRSISNAGSAVASITGHRDNWFRVGRIVDAETDAALFEGGGWVHGSLLGLEVANADPRLHAANDHASRVIARLRPAETRISLIGCAGSWARVRAEGRVGWLSPDGQCSNPLTTCS